VKRRRQNELAASAGRHARLLRAISATKSSVPRRSARRSIISSPGAPCV